jgi:hypothetical protein
MEKEYGHHFYFESTSGNATCNCGCWRRTKEKISGGPLGLDPDGACPCHPMDGKFLGGNADYEYVVTSRITKLERALEEANARWRVIGPTKKTLAAKLEATEEKARTLQEKINKIRAFLD